MLAASLTLIAPAVLKPANFECELVLVSTVQGVGELDDEMSWARREFDPTYPLKANVASPEMDVCKAAVNESAKSTRRFVVIDSSGLKPNHYNPLARKYLGILQSGNEEAPTYERYAATSIHGNVFFSDKGGAGIFGNVHFGASSSAKGAEPPKNLNWPTFSIMGLHDFAEANSIESHYNQSFAKEVDIALLFSTLSVSETAESPAATRLKNNQVCLCAWGTQMPGRPNLIAFPPAGRAVRYKFGHKDGKWFANFIKAY
jgi:hypothetical protein